MNQVIKFPDMRPPNPRPRIRPVPTPAEYRRIVPRFAMGDPVEHVQGPRRKRLWMWLGVAVALHVVLLMALLLTPPMRIKWSPSPDAWVPVTSIPKPEAAQTPPSDTPGPAPAAHKITSDARKPAPGAQKTSAAPSVTVSPITVPADAPAGPATPKNRNPSMRSP